MAEIRIIGLDEDTTMEDVVEVIMKYGKCDRDEIKAGGIRRNTFGEGDIFVKCPWTCATELVRQRRVKIGWLGARVYMMEQAPRQCFRCWEYGHIKAQCKNLKDRTDRCYRCGDEGHKAAECENIPICVLCKDKGRLYNYRMGNRECGIKNGYMRGKR